MYAGGMERKRIIIAAGIAVFIFLAGMGAGMKLSRPDDIYTCVLDEMRGQPESMTQLAWMTCSQRYELPNDAK